jgi:hypothetical protein
MRPAVHDNENFPGSDYSSPEWEFIAAMARFQKQTGKRFPSWRDVLGVVHGLGYRRIDRTTAAATPSHLEIQP